MSSKLISNFSIIIFDHYADDFTIRARTRSTKISSLLKLLEINHFNFRNVQHSYRDVNKLNSRVTRKRKNGVAD